MGRSGRNPVTVYLTDEQSLWLEGEVGPGRTRSGILSWMIEKQRTYLVGCGYRADPNRVIGSSLVSGSFGGSGGGEVLGDGDFRLDRSDGSDIPR